MYLEKDMPVHVEGIEGLLFRVCSLKPCSRKDEG